MSRIYKKKPLDYIFDILNIAGMVIFTFCIIYPFWNQLVLSLNDGKDAVLGGLYFWPRKFTLSNYHVLMTDDSLPRDTLISILRVTVGTLNTLLFTGLLSYVLVQPQFSGRKIIRRIFVFTMYFGGGMIPVYLLMVKLGLTNSFLVYIIPTTISVYYMLLITSYMQNVPLSMMEAARIDGLRELGIYFRVMIPICKPVFAAVSIYLAVGHWNSWFDVLIYNPDGQWDTLQVALRRILLEAEAFDKIENASEAQSKFRNLSVETVRAATTMIVTVPIIILYPFLQKYFVGGITLGAVKG